MGSAAYALPTTSAMQQERAHDATTKQSSCNVSKAHCVFENVRARVANEHGLSNVRAGHDEWDTTREIG